MRVPSTASRRWLLGALGAAATAGTVTGGGPRSRGSTESAATETDRTTAPPDRGWQVTFGASASEVPVALAPGTDGGVAVLGRTRTQNGSAAVTALTPDGDRRWRRVIDASLQQRPRELVRQGDGYVVGGTDEKLDGEHKPWLARLRADGSVAWQRRYDQLGGVYGIQALARAADGGFLLAGIRATAEDDPVVLFRADADGRLRWQRRVATAIDWVTDLAPLPDGGVVMAGHADVRVDASDTNIQAALVGVTATGDQRWRHRFGGAGSDRLSLVRATPAGLLVGGGANGAAPGDGLLSERDPQGRRIWQRTGLRFQPEDIAPLGDGWVIGSFEGLVRVDRYGRPRWNLPSPGRGRTAVTRAGPLLAAASEATDEEGVAVAGYRLR